MLAWCQLSGYDSEGRWPECYLLSLVTISLLALVVHYLPAVAAPACTLLKLVSTKRVYLPLPNNHLQQFLRYVHPHHLRALLYQN